MSFLSDIKRQPAEVVLANLKANSNHDSMQAATQLVGAARDAKLSLRDYLTLAIDTRQGANANRYQAAQLNGYEAALDFLNLPFRTDLEQGVLLQAASDTFVTYPGTRALFPEVIDDMLRWKSRQDQIETTGALVGNSRTISGTELVSTWVEDDQAARGTYTVPELSNIPVHTIRTSETSVRMYKHGSAYRTSYEFNRRMSLDVLTPFATRVARELEISKVKAAVSVLINGDGVNKAAPVSKISEYGADLSSGKSLQHNYKALASFLIKCAQAGTPVDTLAGNLDMYLELLFMFTPTLQNRSEVEALASAGAPGIQLPILGGSVNFALATSVPAGRLVAFNKPETLEELIEAGSSISENEKTITNQSITYVRTEVSGYKLAFGDTRFVLDTRS
jgi:hypothetical protein